MRNLDWSRLVVAAGMLSGCFGADDASSTDSANEDDVLDSRGEALKINSCALVRCRAGTRCQVQQGRPVCVPDGPTAECRNDAECRTFSNYCDGCECLALTSGETDPICKGSLVACFVDPCRNQEARCVQGQCVLGGAAAF